LPSGSSNDASLTTQPIEVVELVDELEPERLAVPVDERSMRVR
jgi:hypothetical protein